MTIKVYEKDVVCIGGALFKETLGGEVGGGEAADVWHSPRLDLLSNN